MPTSVELRAERATIFNEARKSLDLAEKRDGGATEEDKAAFDNAMAGVDKLKADIDRRERAERTAAELDEPGERRSHPLSTELEYMNDDGAKTPRPTTAAERRAFRRWAVRGELREGLSRIARAPDMDDLDADRPETRDTIIGTDAKGGYLIAPKQMTNDLVKAIDDQVFIRRLATITYVTEAKKLGIRKLATRMADANWTTEVGAVTEDTTMAFDVRDLEPYLLSKLAKVSIRAMKLASDVEGLIRDELAYKFGITEEKAFLTGDGSSKPLGVFVASASGISTGRDVTAASATVFTADELIDMKYSLKAGYQNSQSLAWVVGRTFVKMARKLKASGTGEYLWAPGLAAGEPDRILDTRFYISEYAPTTFTTGLYVAVLGDFRYYRIAQVGNFEIQRLNELYAATNEVGFIGREWVDGAPILEEAFARLKLA